MAIDTSLAPYYDDFDETDQFHRILFRPGRAVQARELTQLQTILQNQITRFGQNIFLEGSVVVAAGVSVDTNYEYVKLSGGSSLGALAVGATLVGGTSSVVAEVLQIVPAEDADPDTVYLRYSAGGAGNGGRFQNGETINWTNVAPATGSGAFTAAASAATGTGTKVDLKQGIYFVRGFFVSANDQSLIIEKYGIPTGIQEVGLTVTESIVTSNTDSSLLDNANGTNNFNAPGADRLKYALVLIKKEDVGEDQDYFTVVTLRDAEIISQITRSTYAIIGDEMARRTFDESGNYTVDPFLLDVNPHATDDTKLTLTFDPGKAYVRGYEIEKTLPSTIHIDKALTTETRQNARTSTYFGNYIRVNTVVGAPAIHTFAKCNLVDSGAATIGTARVRGIALESGSIYRVYLFDIQMNSTKSFNQVRTISQASGISATLIGEDNLALSTNVARLYDGDRNTLLFPAPQNRMQSIEDITVRVQRRVVGTTDGSGNVTLDSLNANNTWADTGSWIVFRNDTGAIVTGSASYGASGNQTIAVTGLTPSTEHTFITFIDKTTATSSARSKTIQYGDQEFVTPGSSDINLSTTDIIEVIAIEDVGNSYADIKDRYILDNGQRDNYYADGKLILKAGQPAPVGDVRVEWRYFSHGAGDYFNVDSYNSFLAHADYEYKDIPKHTLADGTVVRLADVWDFRPRLNDAQTDFTGTGGLVNELPKNNETVQADLTYYLPRIDTLYINSQGSFGSVKGAASLNPRAPDVPDNAMAIYRLYLGAGTLDENDLIPNFIDNKRYTMRDIGRIEDRISRVEEWTTLSLLEAETATLEVLDNAGNNRFKSGFFVDNFKTFAFSDFGNAEHRASIDPRLGELRPEVRETNVTMRYTSGDSSGVVKKGDFLLMAYTETVEISQPLASSSINVNPYNVITNTGGITLSPESDEWRDVETETLTRTIRETGTVNPNQNGNFDNWRWNWTGVRDTSGNGVRDDIFTQLV